MTIQSSRSLALGLFVLVVACDPARTAGPAASVPASTRRSTAEQVRIDAANLFTRRYAKSRLSEWKIRAQAAGPRCSVLVVQMSVIMEDSMIEAMHYGTGAYDVVDGGAQRFYRERNFRGVAYKDASDRIWTYGAVSDEEAGKLVECK
jgi:hypothetical protein